MSLKMSKAETDLRVFLSPDSGLPPTGFGGIWPDVIFLVQGEEGGEVQGKEGETGGETGGEWERLGERGRDWGKKLKSGMEAKAIALRKASEGNNIMGGRGDPSDIESTLNYQEEKLIRQNRHDQMASEL